MVARHVLQFNSDKAMKRDQPEPTESDVGKKLIRFCRARRSEKTLLTVRDAIDFMNDNDLQINRFWVLRFAEGRSETLRFQQIRFLETERRKVSEDDLKCHFDAVAIHLQDLLSLFMRNAGETNVGIPKKQVPQEVIVSRQIQPGTVTIAENHDDSQPTLPMAISVSADLTPPMSIKKRRDFETERLAEKWLFHTMII
jgi:hypothetical protein